MSRAFGQRRHPPLHLAGRGLLATGSHVATLTGIYPLVPHAARHWQSKRAGLATTAAPVTTALIEWAVASALSWLRPIGFLPLPGAGTRGPRPVVLLHGYAMNRANFLLLARRLAAAGLGPIYGFEYWSLGRIGSAARRLAEFVDEIRAATGAPEVDLIGHSMGGLVAHYYATLLGGDAVVRNLVTIGSPLQGTGFAVFGLGLTKHELRRSSPVVTRLATAPSLQHTRLTMIWSRGDALVTRVRPARVAIDDVVVFDDLGHLGLLTSRRVAEAIVERLRDEAVPEATPSGPARRTASPSSTG